MRAFDKLDAIAQQQAQRRNALAGAKQISKWVVGLSGGSCCRIENDETCDAARGRPMSWSAGDMQLYTRRRVVLIAGITAASHKVFARRARLRRDW